MSKKTEKEMPPITLNVTIKGDVIPIELPSIGGFIAIERRKIALSGDTHKNMLMGLTKSSLMAYSNVEMIATMEVLIPNFEERIKVRSLSDLKPHEAIDFLKVYNEKVFPWLESWRDFLNTPSEVEETIEKNKKEIGK